MATPRPNVRPYFLPGKLQSSMANWCGRATLRRPRLRVVDLVSSFATSPKRSVDCSWPCSPGSFPLWRFLQFQVSGKFDDKDKSSPVLGRRWQTRNFSQSSVGKCGVADCPYDPSRRSPLRVECRHAGGYRRAYPPRILPNLHRQ
jgi:hypothetical protein